jgi:hypothetical protein
MSLGIDDYLDDEEWNGEQVDLEHAKSKNPN